MLVLAAAAARAHPQGPVPIPAPEPIDAREAWRVVSLLEDAGLERRALFHFDFEADGTIWVAASDGLYRSQGYTWERFGREDGLPSDYVRCVRVTRGGELWVGTDRGAGTFDGRRFDDRATPHLAGPSVRRIREDPDGSLWFCCDRWPRTDVPAGLTRLRGDEWRSFGVADGLPSDYVQDLRVTSTEERFALTARGLARLEGERWQVPEGLATQPNSGDTFWSLVETSPGELLAASTHAYFRREQGRWLRVRGEVPGMPNPVLAQTGDGAVLGLRRGNRPAFMRWGGEDVVPATDSLPVEGLDVQHVAEAPDGAIWAAGLDLLVRWERRGGQWQTYDSLPAPAFTDPRGGVWFADERSVVRRQGQHWWRFPGAHGPLVRAGDSVWMGLGDGLAHWHDGSTQKHPRTAIGLARPRVAAIDGCGTTWAREGDGAPVVANWDGSSWRRLELYQRESGELVRSHTPDPNGGLWVVTRSDSGYRLYRVTGAGEVGPAGWERIPLPAEASSLQEPRLYVGRQEIFAFGFFGLFRRERGDPRLDPEGSSGWSRGAELRGRHVYMLRESGGKLWCGYLGTTGGEAGLAVRDGGHWREYRIGGRMLAGGRGDDLLLFASHAGLYHIAGDQPTPSRLELPPPHEVRVAVFGTGGEAWLKSGEEVLHFRPDGIPPDTLLESSSASITAGEDLRLEVQAVERFHPRVRHARMLVEARVDGGPWRLAGLLDEVGPRLAGLAVGQHRVAVRVVDEANEADPSPAILNVRVHALPWQSRPWFRAALVAVFTALAGLAGFGLVARARLRDQARVLELAVRSRTRELAESESKYRNLFLGSHEAIFLTDGEGRISDANTAALELLEAEEGEVIGRPLGPWFDDGEALEALLGGGVDAACCELELTRHEGRRIVRVRIAPRPDGRGRQVLARDVSEAVRLEQHLRQAQRMEAVGRMAGGIAHDFNNILTIILGHADLLGLRARGDPALEREVEIVVQQALRAQELTRTIQTFSRGESSSGEVRVNELLEGSCDVLRPLLGREIELKLDFDPHVGTACLEAGRLEQVVVNLAVNARDAMPEGGQLRLETRRVQRNGVSDPAGEWVRLEMSDTGAGMDDETRQKLFEPFYTTKPRGQGSGLGLAIVYGIVAQAGGEITVESAPGRGTRFVITLPAGSGRAAPPAPLAEDLRPASRESSHDSPRGSILVVEDEAALRQLLERCLRSAGFRVESSPDGRAALERIESGAGPFDLVVTDVVMPRLGGAALARELRRRDPDQLVLFVSGHVDPEGGGAPPVEGELLVKPFRASELVRRVKTLLNSPPTAAPDGTTRARRRPRTGRPARGSRSSPGPRPG